MKRISWKDGSVISIRLKGGVYCLAQMLKDPYMCFFNCFSNNENWNNVDCNNLDILFIKPVARQFIKSGCISSYLDDSTSALLDIPSRWIKIFPGARQIIVWENTSSEISFITLSDKPGGMLVENRLDHLGRQEQIIISKSVSTDDDFFDKCELDSISIYPEINERLYLCYKEKNNVDPMKLISFDLPIPIEYENYVKIISGKFKIEEVGY